MNQKSDAKPESDLTMSVAKNKTLWPIAIGLIFIVIFFLSTFFRWLPTNGGFGMMGNGYSWHMPMMYAGYGMMGFGTMLFMWLTQLGMLVLIGLGIAWLVRQLKLGKQ